MGRVFIIALTACNRALSAICCVNVWNPGWLNCRTARPSSSKAVSGVTPVKNGSSKIAAADAPTLPEGLLTSFLLTGEHSQSYRQQYANIYFMRLAKLKSVVLENAKRKWSDVAGTPPFSNCYLPYALLISGKSDRNRV